MQILTIQRPPSSTVQAMPGWHIRGAAGERLEECTLVIPTYRRSQQVRALMEHLASLTNPTAEVVVVDGSGHGSLGLALQEWAKGRRLPFDLVYVQSPPGLPLQRNIGIDISSLPYVFFLDDDCLPLPDYFESILRVFAKDRSCEIGAVCGSIINEVEATVSRRWRLRLALGLVPRLAPMKYHESGTSVPRGFMPRFSGVALVDVIPGGASAFRREVFETHRFSEFFTGYAYGEDLEMSLRIRDRWKLACCGDARVLHNAAPDSRPTSFRKGRMEVRNRYFIWKRHSPHASVVNRLRFWLDVTFLVVMDLAWFCARPLKPDFLAHAAGLIWAALSCVVAPPRHDEPPAARRYQLSGISEFGGTTYLA